MLKIGDVFDSRNRRTIMESLLWIFQVLVVISIPLFVGLLLVESQPGTTLKKAVPAISAMLQARPSPSILSAPGAVNILMLPLIAVFYLLFWRKELIASKGVAPLRDLFAIYIFSAFAVALFPNMAGAYAMSAGLCTAMHTVYLLSAIGNFGGLGRGETPREVAIGLATILLLTVVGALPRFLKSGVDASGILLTFFEMALVYVLGFVAKIMFFADSMLTFKMKYNWMRAGFGLLAVFLLFPVVGFVVNFILYPLAGLLSLPFTGFWPAISFSTFLSGALSFITVPAVYLAHLAQTNPFSLVMLFLAVCYDVSGYPKAVDGHAAHRIAPGQGSFLLRFFAPFSLEPLKKGMIPIYLLGGGACVLSIMMLFEVWK